MQVCEWQTSWKSRGGLCSSLYVQTAGLFHFSVRCVFCDFSTLPENVFARLRDCAPAYSASFLRLLSVD